MVASTDVGLAPSDVVSCLAIIGGVSASCLIEGRGWDVVVGIGAASIAIVGVGEPTPIILCYLYLQIYCPCTIQMISKPLGKRGCLIQSY